MRTVIIISAACIAIALGVVFLRVTTINTIESTPPLTDTVTQRFRGRNLLTLSETEVANTVMKGYPLLESVSVTKQFPGTLVIDAKKAQSFAKLTYAKGDTALIVSAKGKILLQHDQTNKSALPSLYYYGDIPSYMRRVGTVIDLSEITYALQLFAHLNSYSNKPQSIAISRPGVIEVGFKTETPIYLLTTQKNVDKNSRLVHNIQEMLKRESISVSRVDMRYDKPILIK